VSTVSTVVAGVSAVSTVVAIVVAVGTVVAVVVTVVNGGVVSDLTVVATMTVTILGKAKATLAENSVAAVDAGTLVTTAVEAVVTVMSVVDGVLGGSLVVLDREVSISSLMSAGTTVVSVDTNSGSNFVSSMDGSAGLTVDTVGVEATSTAGSLSLEITSSLEVKV
jgi:hypothetical protein